jgi:apolipoprotein N-acyltransferase
VVNNHGQVTARSALSERAVIVRTVRLRTGSTFYERFGDLPVVVLSLILVVAGWALGGLSRMPSLLERQRRRRPQA